MKKIYEAGNGVEAHMVLHMLEQQGIQGRIDGEYLAGGVGDLPAMGMVRVMVEESDAGRAREIIRDWERQQPAAVDREMPVVRSRFHTVLAVLVGALIGGSVVWVTLRAPGARDTVDYDDDGLPDEYLFYARNGVLERIEWDRNRDGRTDAIATYDFKGAPKAGRQDDNFDGHFEAIYEAERAWIASTSITQTGNDHPEYRELFTHGVLASAEYLDPATGAVRKKVAFRHGWPVSAQLDTDGDGSLETEHVYDRIGEITTTRTLQ